VPAARPPDALPPVRLPACTHACMPALYTAILPPQAALVPCRIGVQDFAAGRTAPFPLLQPAPSHAAQHLLLDCALAVPAALPPRGRQAGKADPDGNGSSAVKADGDVHADPDLDIETPGPTGTGAPGVLNSVAAMLDAALVAAGLAVQRRQFQAFASFRQQRQSSWNEGEQQQEQQQQGSNNDQGETVCKAGQAVVAGASGAPDMLYFSCR
jgi:hypothetical protein